VRLVQAPVEAEADQEERLMEDLAEWADRMLRESAKEFRDLAMALAADLDDSAFTEATLVYLRAFDKVMEKA
jgi:hypothetical protein